jgi:hypothetical protein
MTYSTRVATTDDTSLSTAEALSSQSWEKLSRLLHQRLDAPGSHEFALLLAEPVRHEGRTDWLVTSNHEPRRLAALDAAARDALIARLQAARERVRTLADEYSRSRLESDQNLAAALRAAVEVADESRHVYELNGQPVLVAWGRMPTGALPPPPPIVAGTRVDPGDTPPVPPTPEPAPAAPVQAAHETPPPAPARFSLPRAPVLTTPGVRAARWRLGWQVPAWLLFICLLVVLYRLLLAACGLWLTPSGDAALGFCRGGDTGSLAAEAARSRALEEQVHAQEAELARRIASCDVPGTTGQRTTPPTPPIAEREQSRSIEQRLQERGAARGALNISLKWDTTDDLDISVRCPDGSVISFQNHNACGGRLQVDMNACVPEQSAGNRCRIPRVEHPVEDVIWTGPPPTGEYQIFVRYYDADTATARSVPFVVRVRIGDREQLISGVAPRPDRDGQLVYKFRID